MSMVVVTSVAFSGNGVEAIDKMVSKIQQPREGAALEELASTKNPFITLKKDENITKIVVPKKRQEKFVLNGIVNQKAFINGEWHKVGDDISGYTLKYIGTRGVVLTDANNIKRLFLHRENKGIIMMKEGE